MTSVQPKLIFPLDPFSSWLFSLIAFDLIAEVIPPCPCIRWIAKVFQVLLSQENIFLLSQENIFLLPLGNTNLFKWVFCSSRLSTHSWCQNYNWARELMVSKSYTTLVDWRRSKRIQRSPKSPRSRLLEVMFLPFAIFCFQWSNVTLSRWLFFDFSIIYFIYIPNIYKNIAIVSRTR
jgi:hypothetical protein